MKESATSAPVETDDATAAAPARAHDRAHGLSPSARRLLTEISGYAQRRQPAEAEKLMPGLMALAPTHPEVLRIAAIIAHQRGHYDEAARLLRRVVQAQPHDALPWNNLGSALAQRGDLEGAIVAFRKCAELAPQRAPPWFNLGRALDMLGRVDEAHAALVEALRRDPAHVSARVTLARVLQFMGRIDDAEREYRTVLAAHADSALAWYGLSTLRTSRFSVEDLGAIESVYGRNDLGDDERIAAGFALTKALEDQQRYAEAFAVLTAANSAKRRLLNWDAHLFSQYVGSLEQAFANPPSSSAPAALGHEVIFVFGLPRSGSTLVEHILASHPQVSGANELEDLNKIFIAESQRRGSPFPAWVPQMQAHEWERLGNEYLERTATWRRERPIFTDKGLMNWGYAGAIRAMLPGARMVNCRRDAVENCLACFRQLFQQELGFTYDLAEIAAFWRDHDRLVRHWHRRFPDRIHDVVHEQLVSDPETQIRALLDFCGLPFDDACLRFHESERNVRTASAAQVRQPLRADTARASRYGALLDPLRAMLAYGTAGPR